MILANGSYRAVATGHVHAAPAGKSASVNVNFKLLEGPDEGKSITAYLYLTDKTKARTVESLVTAGWDGTDWENLTGVGSKEVVLVLADETYQGDTNTKVKWINDPSRGVGIKAEDRMAPALVKSFAAEMRALAKDVRANKPPAAEREPGDDSDDLAF